MQIQLRKIHENRHSFSVKKEDITCSGEFWRSGKHNVTIDGTIEGNIHLHCDRCGEAFAKHVCEPFHIEVVDRPLKVDESLDVIECLDGIVDFDTICESEIASIESEYHLCPDCGKEDNFEIEL
ncbi:hypothetical protein [Hydrogenimonas sp.]|uniref:YceD family protein n=1 Tax=Hydrogenimonas sp. TaxID=2231112 RepID=UPI002630E3D2|nr:hypothetical protein [Hydrogenimonas sp.]